MQIQGNALFSVLGSLQPSKPGGAAQTGTAQSAKPAAETQARPVPRSAPAESTAAAASPSRTQELEQAVQTLSDQGRLPPRGSLVDLRA